jgi:membrane-associated phospholipid phosphatase
VLALAVAAVVLGAGLVAALYLVFVRARAGQSFDHRAFLHVVADQDLARDLTSVLNDTVIGLAVVTLAAGMAVALVRGRPTGAIAAAVLVGGANATTQLLKHGLLTRPHLGYETTNSLPSGHTTVAVSVAMGLLLVLPVGARPLLLLAGSAAANLVAVGVLVAGWHRPSDVLASAGVCLVWAGLVTCWLVLRTGAAPPARGGGWSQAVAGFAGAAAVVVLAFGLRPREPWIEPVEQVGIIAAVALGTTLCLVLAARLLPGNR